MACISLSEFKALPADEKLARTMAGFRRKETGSFAGNYTAHNTAGAGGAYQFIAPTWRGWLKEFDLSGPPEAWQASKALQDEVAGRAFQNLLTRFKDDIFKVGVFWFLPKALSVPALMDVVPNQFNRETPRQYATSLVNHVLCGASGGEIYTSGSGFFYTWKNLPICVQEPRIGGEDVVQLKAIFGITTGPDVYGTALQFKVAQFQLNNNLPVTGCFDQKTADALTASLGSGDFSSTYSPVASSGIVQAVLSNKNITFDGSFTSDLTKGFYTGSTHYNVDEKILRFMLGFAQHHSFNVSCIGSDHPLLISGTSHVSLHRYGKAIDINYVDGNHMVSAPVPFWDSIVKEMMVMPAEFRPARIGMTDLSRLSGTNGVVVFRQSDHRNHLHTSF